MAQTYKFGNGTWANKEGSTLAYNDEGNNYKPLPFSFERDSIGTRVNKEGLIEVVGKDKPRIDYTDSADGVLLLENSATNLINYSEDFSNSSWSKTGATITSNAVISPDGTLNADLFNINNPSGQDIVSKSFSFSSGLKNNISIFVKDNDFNGQLILGISSNLVTITYDFSTQTILSNIGSWLESVNINKGFNGFNRIDFTINPTFNSFALFQIRTNNQGSGSFYIWGGQLEANSIASSYIPTSGSTVQRAAETANGSGNSEVFNSQEGILFANIAALADDGTARTISVNNTVSNRVFLQLRSSTGQVNSGVVVGGSLQGNAMNYPISQTSNIKFLIKYKVNDFALWVNGFEVGTSTGNVFSSGTLNDLSFDSGDGAEDFYGKTKELGYYDTALTDAELEYMTSYRSLNELVTELNLNTL